MFYVIFRSLSPCLQVRVLNVVLSRTGKGLCRFQVVLRYNAVKKNLASIIDHVFTDHLNHCQVLKMFTA